MADFYYSKGHPYEKTFRFSTDERIMLKTVRQTLAAVVFYAERRDIGRYERACFSFYLSQLKYLHLHVRALAGWAGFADLQNCKKGRAALSKLWALDKELSDVEKIYEVL